MTANADYQVSFELMGHEGAIRSISLLNSDIIATGAMDSVVKLWIRDPESPTSAYISLDSATIYAHEHWVTAVTSLPPQLVPECPGGGLVTGSMDKAIRIFNLEGECIAILRGHEGGVTSLAISHCGKYLLSGSWDGTARVWDLRTKQNIHVLSGHENGVCVLDLPDGTIVTGSTGRQVGNTVVDFQLRFWTNFSLTKTVADHQGPIRQLALLPDIGFVSCSNDGFIKVRSLDGQIVASMAHPLNAEGKPGFVLGVTVLSDGRIVSASEDCTACVWTADGTLVQSIEHPGGLWCVTALPNGDFITGCDDKIARVFTTDTKRVAPEAVASFQHAVEEARLVKQRGPSGVEIEKLPDYDRRIQVVGKSDGQIQMFRRGNKAFACQWSGPSRTWVDIGEVTGTGSGGVVDGEAYDMVIPVEIETPGGGGIRKLEIGYNQGQNPFMVAQEFINKHMLDQAYLKEIADYITQRASEYHPPVLGNNESVNVESASAGTAITPDSSNAAVYKYFPVAGYNTFETTKIGKLMTTIRQFNEKLSSTTVTPLTDRELISLEEVVRVVQETAYYHSSSFTTFEINALKTVISTWPPEFVFPALDLLRLVLIHPQGASALGDTAVDSLPADVLCIGLQRTTLNDGESIPMATRMLALRVLANMFLHGRTRKAVLDHKDKARDISFHFARVQIEQPGALSNEDVIAIGSMAAELLNGPYSVDELGDNTILRSMVTIGTLALRASNETKELLAVHVNIFVAGKANSVSSQAVEECLAELQRLLN